MLRGWGRRRCCHMLDTGCSRGGLARAVRRPPLPPCPDPAAAAHTPSLGSSRLLQLSATPWQRRRAGQAAARRRPSHRPSLQRPGALQPHLTLRQVPSCRPKRPGQAGSRALGEPACHMGMPIAPACVPLGAPAAVPRSWRTDRPSRRLAGSAALLACQRRSRRLPPCSGRWRLCKRRMEKLDKRSSRGETAANSVGSWIYRTTCMGQYSMKQAGYICGSGAPAAAAAGSWLPPAGREVRGEHGANGALAGARHQLHHCGLPKQAPNLHCSLVAQRCRQPATQRRAQALRALHRQPVQGSTFCCQHSACR